MAASKEEGYLLKAGSKFFVQRQVRNHSVTQVHFARTFTVIQIHSKYLNSLWTCDLCVFISLALHDCNKKLDHLQKFPRLDLQSPIPRPDL
jgi:hypothetical protein